MARTANQPSRRRSTHLEPVAGARADTAAWEELRRRAEDALAGPASSDAWSLRYLESSRLLVPPPAPLDPAEQHKLTQELADLVADVITKVLDGLGLSDADWERGRNIAMEALSSVAQEGWVPL